jgi:predicted acyl esterase
MDFLGEAIAWWNRWLKDEANGVEDVPQVRAFILDGPKPALRRAVEPGRWVAMDRWTAPEVLTLHGQPGRRLGPEPSEDSEPLFLRSPEDTGTMAGEWFTLKPDAEMAGDQRPDDAGSLTFETAVLTAPVELLGFPRIALRLTPEAAGGNLVARLVDIHPTGEATRISFGTLNLTHRNGNAEPAALEPGVPVEVTLHLDACGYRLAPGHILRLSLSTAYWPMVLPGPQSAGIAIDAASLRLALPLLGADAKTVDLPEPANPNPLPTYVEHAPAVSRRSVERDLMAGVTRYRLLEDTGLFEHPDTGLATRQVRDETWTIAPDDPLSMVGETRWSTEMRRGDWVVTTQTLASLSCTATDFHYSAEARAFEGERAVHVKTWDGAIPRDFL